MHDRSALWADTRAVKKAGVCFLISIFAVSSPAFGREAPADLTHMSLQDLMNLPVYGASRFEQSMSEAPSSVSVITADEIRKYGYRTIDDILQSSRGFSVTSDRNYSYTGIRGFNRPGDYNGSILFLVDGHRINENIYDGGLLGTAFPVDIDLIDRIEIIRGPSSSLYGASAFFGVINIITRGVQNLTGTELAGSAGGDETYEGRLSYGHEFQNSASMVLSASGHESDGQQRIYFREYDAPATNNGIAERVDGEESYHVFSKLAYQGFTLEGVLSSRTKTIPTGAFDTIFNDPRSFTTDERNYAALSYRASLSPQNELRLRTHYDQYDYRGDYAFEGADPAGNPLTDVNKDRGQGEWWGAEVQLTNTTYEKHKINLGAEYRDNLKQLQSNYNISDPAGSAVLDRRSSSVAAVYVQDEYRLARDLLVNAGVRNDQYTTFGNTTNPRLALIYQPSGPTVLKALYGTAFRAPSVYELYYSDGGLTSKPSEDLRPEQIKTYELVYEQQIGEKLHSVATAYYYRIEDLISQQTDPADGLIVFENIDRVGTRGAEFEVEGKWDNGVKTRISYSLQKARDLTLGQALVNSPEQLFKLNLIAPVAGEKIFLALEEQYTGARTSLQGNDLGGFSLTNITLYAHQVFEGAAFSVSAYNVFDRQYGDPGAAEHLQDVIPREGRNYRLKLTYAF